MDKNKYNIITILGPTATGKTKLAAHLAYKLGSGVISADSRQVYKNMDIGTGKDLEDFNVQGSIIPYHLINICNAGEKYNVYEYQRDFFEIFNLYTAKNTIPILCGGSGMYIESVLKAYQMTAVPINESLRERLNLKTDEELQNLLRTLKNIHNKSDFDTRKRTIRAIEIEIYQQENKITPLQYPELKSLLIGIHFERNDIRDKITQRLHQRIQSGMIDEVKNLLKKGIKSEDLIYYGLEYKYITLYLTKQLEYNEMVNHLNTAIHQFAKRQSTWFRKMEREGNKIHWIDGHLSIEEKVNEVLQLL